MNEKERNLYAAIHKDLSYFKDVITRPERAVQKLHRVCNSKQPQCKNCKNLSAKMAKTSVQKLQRIIDI